MKNIHLIQTEKPSRLTKNNLGKFIILNGFQYQEVNQNYNIYITSDEVIKEGDWFYLDMSHSNTLPDEIHQMGNDKWSKTGGIHFCEGNTWVDSCKKIILTTDPQLIADGVQAIDDEFLEWFVKNPTCEVVEVVEGVRLEDEWIDNEDGGEIFQHQYCCYEIIIPKKETKSLMEKLKPLQEQWQRDMLKTLQEPKQEPLEEAAENYVRNESDDTLKLISKYSFRDGAKWQSKIMYSEEDMKSFGKFCSEYDYRCFGSKTQEEMLSIWFEQFKKK